MVNKIYVVTDLGPGDGGKGGVVHKISKIMRAHTVIKVGGAQGSHGVVTSAGQKFAFSQWGCGTFDGIKTHISSRMVISPEGLLNEADILRFEHGIHDIFDLLTVDQRALCATPYHGIASRLKEMALRNNPRGTVGTGVGEAYRCSERFPEMTIRAGDLSRKDLGDFLIAIREQIRQDLNPIAQGNFLPDDQCAIEEEMSLLYDDKFLNYVESRFKEVSKLVKIVGVDYLGQKILSQDGVAVVESSHGILTDCFQGFHPHTSAIRTLPHFTHEMLKQAGYDGQVVNIGVTRAYQIRHGAGPMPTNDPRMVGSLLPSSHKNENRYQGKVRVGPLDLVLLRYAIDVCGGPTAFDGLAITWFDQIKANGVWHICDRYHNIDSINVQCGADSEQLKHQENLGKQLSSCLPKITTYEISPAATIDNLYSLCASVLEEKVNVPVRMVSFGPTELDKICK